ncbi:intracellular ribonuclease LX precursor, putative [Entamoeba invadens IP1]|uniref:Intracellular ribonuclease LX, putative n=1 Tax=Entamoeba invadens IP1 TaxID=370355 RepID=L7FPE2_ENTIV|nr:intracellular ribonuclease LX precursor, putative [Entamoeba invadens IP1]ELP94540.1 intracellular ribonuclease LX precursor, putative [Entamoeba invadens IP1]|eukprot:XP_004261311.1 intracellular ribonuclease LX precursor, putative [Entamoeba invadens IP1]
MFWILLVFLELSFGQPDKKKTEDNYEDEFPSLQPLDRSLPQPHPFDERPPSFRSRGRGQTRRQRPFIPQNYPQQQFDLPPHQQPLDQQQVPQTQQHQIKDLKHQTSKLSKELLKPTEQTRQTPQREEQVVRPKITAQLQKVYLPTPPKPAKQTEMDVKLKVKTNKKQQLIKEAKKKEFPFLPPNCQFFNQIPVTPDIFPMKKILETLSSYTMCKYYSNFYDPDFFVHSQYWLGELCIDGNCDFPENTEVKEGFTLHGYWPHFYKNRNMYCCTNFFGPDNVENMLLQDTELMMDVNKKWMSVKECRFAVYQWDKHGSCAMRMFKGPKGPTDYMRTAIKLFDRVNIWDLLQRSELKIETGKLYHKKDIKKVLKNYFGVDVSICCRNDNSLYEVNVCYDAKGNSKYPKLINCPDKIFRYDDVRCRDMIKLLPLPEYLRNPEKIPRNKCPY